MSRQIDTDICVIGAGSAGLSVAAGASQMGAATVLVERGAMGGDCLNTGCVPSKALLAAAHRAQVWRDSAEFGLAAAEPEVDFAAVRRHVRGVIDAIAPHDSVERFTGLGVTVLAGTARFTGPRGLRVDGADGTTTQVTARRFVVATGSRASLPPIPGIDAVPVLTNETVFENPVRPTHLLVLGGGPIGLEMAQAHRRLGSRVTVLELDRILPRDDPELVAVLRDRLTAEGIEILEGARVARLEPAEGGGVRAHLSDATGQDRAIDGSHLLAATGRQAVVEGLDLESAGIAYTAKGITVDAGLRTSNRRVYAIGDVAGGPQFTHVAGYHAGLVVRSALFRLPAKVDYRALPWVTYTDPELAQVGLSEAAARERLGDRKVRVLRWSFAENDRAQAERRTEGRVKAVLDGRGRVLGAAIVGPGAGELIQSWGLAIHSRLKIGKLATLIAPYPTLGEASKRAAGSYYTDSLFSERTRRIVRFLARFG